MSLTYAYQRTARFLLELCRASCRELRAVNKNVAGCQFDLQFEQWDVSPPHSSGIPEYSVPSGGYEDCLFFKGEDIVYPHEIETESVDTNFDCLVFKIEKTESPRYGKIHPVDRKTGTVADGPRGKVSWVLLR